MQFIYPYLILKDTLEASNFYKDVFDGEITYIMRGKDVPDCPEDQLEAIMHLQLKFNDNQIYMADGDEPTSEFIHIHLDYQNLDELMAVYEKLKEGSIAKEKPAERFWGAVMGSVKDKFGVTWQLHHSLPQK